MPRAGAGGTGRVGEPAADRAPPAAAEPRCRELYTFTRPWSDGTTGIKLSPMELLKKLPASLAKKLPFATPEPHSGGAHGIRQQYPLLLTPRQLLPPSYEFAPDPVGSRSHQWQWRGQGVTAVHAVDGGRMNGSRLVIDRSVALLDAAVATASSGVSGVSRSGAG